MALAWHDDARRMKADGMNLAEIARQLGRSVNYVRDVVNGHIAKRTADERERRAKRRGERQLASLPPPVAAPPPFTSLNAFEIRRLSKTGMRRTAIAATLRLSYREIDHALSERLPQ